MMNDPFFMQPDISRFRANDEDVNAYVYGIIQKTDKQDILAWIHHLSDHDLHSLLIPFITEKLTSELGENELE